MKNLSLFSLLVMIGMVLFLGGCAKDEEILKAEKSNQTSVRSDLNTEYDLPSDHPFSKRNLDKNVYNELPDDTWNPKHLIKSFEIYSKIQCDNVIDLNNYGQPFWQGSLYHKYGDKEITTTPMRDKDENVIAVYSIFTSTDKEGFHFFTNFEDIKIEGLPINWFLSLIGLKKTCPWDVTWGDKFINFFVNMWGGLIGSLNGAGTSNAGSFTYFSNLGTSSSGNGNPNGGITNIGGGGSTLNDYVNPTGSFFTCDLRLTTKEGCFEYFRDVLGFKMDYEFKDFEYKLQTCGCFHAVMSATQNWSNLTPGERCMDCYSGFYGEKRNYDFLIVESIIKSIKIPCSNADQTYINQIKDELYTEVCNSIARPKYGVYPGKLLADFLNKLEERGYDYYATKPKIPSGNTFGAASLKMAQLITVMGLTPEEIDQMNEADICIKSDIIDCLLPVALDQPTNISNEERAKLLDFYLNTTLINPCTGEDIDKDDIFMNLCENGGMSLAGLDAALDGVDYIIKEKTFENCKALNCIYEHLLNSGSEMFCNNIYRFNYSDKIDLTIKVGTTDWNAEGTVAMSTNGTGVIMTFANFNCNETDHLKLAETILHESFHAKLRFDIAKNNNVSEAEFRAKFLIYIQESYGIKYNTEHKIMLKEYFDKAAAELMALNGNKYDISYYKAYVWDGLSDDFTDLFDQATIDDWKAKRNILKADLSTFKCQ